MIVAGASGNDVGSVEFILENISKRMAENMREDAKEIANPAEEDVEAAMLRVVGVIRGLEAAGEIFFVAKED